jgi:heme/copper-type cytochrome/quinol oxidase subunit 2
MRLLFLKTAKHAGVFIAPAMLGLCLAAGASSAAEDQHSVAATDSDRAFQMLSKPPHQAADLTIQITGEQRRWTFVYAAPPGPKFLSGSDTASATAGAPAGELVIPQGHAVELIVTSQDEIYELAIPELGVAVTAIPGRLQTLHVTTAKTGLFSSVCVGGCADGNRPDPITIRVVSKAAYDEWLRHDSERRP